MNMCNRLIIQCHVFRYLISLYCLHKVVSEYNSRTNPIPGESCSFNRTGRFDVRQ